MRHSLAILSLLMMLLALGGCQTSPPQARRQPGDLSSPLPSGTKIGLEFTLSEGRANDAVAPPSSTAKTVPLSEAETASLLAQLPDISAKTEVKEFAMREKSAPPPASTQTVEMPFPPPPSEATPSRPDTDKLVVASYAPQGEVGTAARLSVTFNQPMVPLASQAELARLSPPLQITPEIAGEWRWVGSNTALFEPRGSNGPPHRFPMASEFKIETAANLASVQGQTLDSPFSWTFRTKPVILSDFGVKNVPNPLEPIFWVKSDQEIDPQAVLNSARIENQPALTLRLATPEEITTAKLEDDRRRIAFKIKEKLRPATAYKIVFGPGVPSAEGPLKSAKPQSFTHKTYEKLAVFERYPNPAEPNDTLRVEFNNELDPETVNPDLLKVNPAIPELHVIPTGNILNLLGKTKGNTTYTVTLDPSIRDQYGQTLGPSEPIKFPVRKSQASLEGPEQALVTLDPMGPPALSVLVTNIAKLKVQAYSVNPEDWPNFWKRYDHSYETSFDSLGHQVLDSMIATHAKPDEKTEVKLDLSKALPQGHGMLVLVVSDPTKKGRDQRRRVYWVQATDLGVDVCSDATTLHAMATSLTTGKPLDNVQLELLGSQGQSLAQGKAGTPLALPSDPAKVLIARSNGDAALMTHYLYGYGEWKKLPTKDRLLWYVVDDRKLYRPGEKVSIKGWIRRWPTGPNPQLQDLDGGVGKLDWNLGDSDQKLLLKGTTSLTADGSFQLQLDLPKTMNLGSTRLDLGIQGPWGSQGHSHDFNVQEFRRPEFEVTASCDKTDALIGEAATASVQASYFSGGGLAGAPVEWTVWATPADYSPPGHDDFRFGSARSDWDDSDVFLDQWSLMEKSGPSQSHTGRTGAKGRHDLRIDFLSVTPTQPMTVNAEAQVSDVNRQAWTAKTTLLVHPSETYVGLRTSKAFIKQGEALEIEVLVCDIEGKMLANVPVDAAVWREESHWDEGKLKTTRDNVENRSSVSKTGPVKLTFQPERGGAYTVKARVYDEKGRPNETSFTIWVSQEGQTKPATLEGEKLTLIPDKTEYQAGETAEVLVLSPLSGGEALVTLSRGGILKTEQTSLEGGSTVLKVPITDDLVPGLHLRVDASGLSESIGVERPAFASGEVELKVPPLKRTLTVKVTPTESAVDPGGKSAIDVEVSDADGKPLQNAEVALFAVDESVLATAGYTMPDPIETFYAKGHDFVTSAQSRSTLVLAPGQEEQDDFAERLAYLQGSLQVGQGSVPSDAYGFDLSGLTSVRLDSAWAHSQYRPRKKLFPNGPLALHLLGATGVDDQGLRAQESGTGFTARGLLGLSIRVSGDIAAGAEFSAYLDPTQQSGPAQQLKARTDFNPTALFAPALKTDSQGKVSVPFHLPDSLTRYRLTAIATDGANRFGKGDSTLTARLPLMVRPSPPRFLNFGDKLELPVVVQNQTGQAMQVKLVARAVNLDLAKNPGYRLTVPANDRVEVRFPVSASQAGQATLQVGATSDRAADSAEVSFPVWTPATSEAFATYGEVSEGAISQDVQAPDDAFPQFGGLEMTISSSALSSLSDALSLLLESPYDTAEESASRVLATIALADVAELFEAAGLPNKGALKAQVDKDLKRLESLQKADGGFSFWPSGQEDWPFLSVHVAHAVTRAEAAGNKVPATLRKRSVAYLHNIKSHLPKSYDTRSKLTIRAYALYVRHRLGEKNHQEVKTLLRDAGGVSKLPLEAVGWLYEAMGTDPSFEVETSEIQRHLSNRVSQTSGGAHFVSDYDESSGYLVFAGNRRADGILLEALLQQQSDSPLIPKLVRKLQADRTRGQWGSSQDNCFVLLALSEYFREREKATPDFKAAGWLGAESLFEQTFHGRQAKAHSLHLPMSLLAGKGVQNFVLSKTGPGRLYYRLGLDYASTNLRVQPLDRGFAVERRYQGVDKADDVKRQSDGSWSVKAGARVRVVLTMATPENRYHVALVDPLPAGLETINRDLAGSSTAPTEVQGERWAEAWVERENLRDERAEAFASRLTGRVYEYTYLTRATTLGVFVVPPTRAEEIFAPETFGRSGADSMTIR